MQEAGEDSSARANAQEGKLPTGKPSARNPSRMRSTIESISAVRRMDMYLESSGMGLTEFATRIQTTDRTLRNFRKTGKCRRGMFDAIAKQLGTNREGLLKPD